MEEQPRDTRTRREMRLSFYEKGKYCVKQSNRNAQRWSGRFTQAAESVRDPELKALFGQYSQQRSRFAAALQSEARSHAETKPETSSSATGALHRGWINLKSAITGGNDHAIVAECERGEDSAVEEYKKALDDGLTPSAQELVTRQFADIKAAHDHIKNLRDATKS